MIISVWLGIAVACDDSRNVDSENIGHDSHLYGEWVEDDGSYVWAYYSFYRDDTGIEGSYEPDIDFVNEDSDIEWYTVDDELLYIDGAPYEYWCECVLLDNASARC